MVEGATRKSVAASATVTYSSSTARIGSIPPQVDAVSKCLYLFIVYQERPSVTEKWGNFARVRPMRPESATGHTLCRLYCLDRRAGRRMALTPAAISWIADGRRVLASPGRVDRLLRPHGRRCGHAARSLVRGRLRAAQHLSSARGGRCPRLRGVYVRYLPRRHRRRRSRACSAHPPILSRVV